MANLNGFNANEVEPNAGFEAIPAGKYIAAITDSQMKATKNASGSFLELEFTITEGEYKNRKIWDRLCLNHSNPQTVTIARGNLSAICRAVNVLQPQDSVELHNIPLQITVKLKKMDDGDLTNEIKGYGAKSSSQSQSTQPGSIPPWRR